MRPSQQRQEQRQHQLQHPYSNLFLLRLLVQEGGEGCEGWRIKVQHLFGNEARYLESRNCQALVEALLALTDQDHTESD